jgi:predicted MFS family arabinose efflux permease
VARWRAGLLADRVGTPRLLPAASVVCAAGLAGVAAGLVRGEGVGTLVLLVAATVCGVGYGAVQNLTLVAAFARVEGEDTPTASAVWNLSFDGGTAIGATAVGAVAGWTLAGGTDVGVPAALLACAALVAITAPLGTVGGRGATAPAGRSA